ncbi:hypothetical protein [Bradyrhizobium betae]|uniref:Uncharacterized protein n=1 Tax=Bradyrhizobium betae TaxID=244734 RepID=A0A5P6PF27_9BRAD|nr:hypothetical protein [Bradyrhizobium betae]MCS3725913.1 hypothetical protein [Bradyrhizobium betae]QFI76962.1 hypothetical protein F8237_33990 [Bradyrhizobium betae]
MVAILAELLLVVVRSLVADWLKQAAFAVCAWLDTTIHGRTARFVVGGLLGLAAFILIPVFAGLLGL